MDEGSKPIIYTFVYYFKHFVKREILMKHEQTVPPFTVRALDFVPKIFRAVPCLPLFYFAQD